MPALNCMATTCIYNRDELCSRGDIEVKGHGAEYAGETCCHSFREKSESSVTNSTVAGCGCSKIDVKCEAEKCIYNDDCRCNAGQINIDGPSACTCDETECETFRVNG